ncbi:DUF3726 domain-containing protein [Pacificoceanicola onchidii]|uniref:DUF3726 domain-containing protein n=1 Tax=Pacificoceanicola onchidii TaxID=2562685 RepID=UPI0010A465F4|nr:DUF3726 domain-containing protein [Pacificoceanicola onchidii]
MSRSANEIMTLAQKAARGAGFPPHQADRFGRAAAVHLASGHGTEALRRALTDAKDSPILRLPLLMDDMLRAMDQLGGDVELTLHPGDEPLAPAYARLLPIRVKECSVLEPEDRQNRLRVVLDPMMPGKPSFPPRIHAPDAFIEELSALAEKTFVPESAASRSAGAGAGEIDND